MFIRKIENFIRTKYESKRWVMDGPMPDPATLDDDDDVVSLPVFIIACNVSNADNITIAPQCRPREGEIRALIFTASLVDCQSTTSTNATSSPQRRSIWRCAGTTCSAKHH